MNLAIPRPPERLFKFIGNQSFLLETLSTPYIWFADVQKFNDPFETEGCFTLPPFSEHDHDRYLSLFVQHQIFVSQGDYNKISPLEQTLTSEELYDSLHYNYLKLHKELMQEIFVKRMGVCCFVRDEPVSATRDEACPRGVAHLNRLMWSHYAKGLAGVCLEFDAQVLYQSLSESNPNYPITVAEIEYSEDRPSIDMFDFMASVYANRPKSGLGQAMRFVTSKDTKSTVWSYENEMRFKALGAIDEKLFYSPKALKRVYLGQRLRPEEKVQIKKVLNEIGVYDLREVVLKEHSFQLEDIPLYI